MNTLSQSLITFDMGIKAICLVIWLFHALHAIFQRNAVPVTGWLVDWSSKLSVYLIIVIGHDTIFITNSQPGVKYKKKNEIKKYTESWTRAHTQILNSKEQ